MIQLKQKTVPQIAEVVAGRVRKRRKELHFTQAERAEMRFASCKRFEQKHEIAFDSLVNIAVAFGCEKDFDALVAPSFFSSIEDIIQSEKS